MGATAAALSSRRQLAHWLEVIAEPVRLHILRSLSQADEATTAELAAESQASYQTLRRHLEALEAFGLIEVHPGKSDGETSGRPPTRFSLMPGVRQALREVFGESE